MTLSVTHSTVTGAAADSTALVDGVAWDAAHTLTGTASAAQLNENVVQSVTNDTNVTGSISAQNLTFAWASTLSPARGGTGVANNAASTWTISGNYATTITVTGVTGVTLPTTGTLATLAGAETLTNKSLGTLRISGVISPSQITADQDNYAPTGLSSASVVRINSDAARNITGLSAGSDGDIKIVENVGAFAITLKDESASSTAANRFALTADQILSVDSVVILKYDGTSARWRAAGGGGSTFLDSLFTLQDNSDTTKQAQFQLSGISTGTTRTWTFPDANDTFLGLTATQSPTNKTFDNTNTITARDDRFTLQDNSDTTKQAVFELSGITTATTRTYTLPNASGTLLYSGGALGTPASGTLTNATGLPLSTGVTGYLPVSNLYGSLVAPQGRLTLTSATPVMTSSVASATTIYYALYSGNLVPLYDGTNYVPTVFTELSQATTDSTKSPAACTTNSNYDLFVWSDSGTIRCTRGPAWSSDTSRGTGAGTTELELVNGIYLNKVAITNGPSANRGTYVGTVRTDGSSQVNFVFGTVAANWGMGTFGVWNAYNRVHVASFNGDSTDSWTYAVATWRASNGNSTARFNFVRGLDEDMIEAKYSMITIAGASSATRAGIGLDTTTSFNGSNAYNSNSSFIANTVAVYSGLPGIGFHYVSANEINANATAGTWYGDAGNTTTQSGMHFSGLM